MNRARLVSRWFGEMLSDQPSPDVIARLEGQAAAVGFTSVDSILGAGWQALLGDASFEVLHPRDQKGRWIEKLGWVNFISGLSGKKRRGQVMDIREGKGGQSEVYVRVVDQGGKTTGFETISPKEVTESFKAKARIDEPDVPTDVGAPEAPAAKKPGKPGTIYAPGNEDLAERFRAAQEEYGAVGTQPGTFELGSDAKTKYNAEMDAINAELAERNATEAAPSLAPTAAPEALANQNLPMEVLLNAPYDQSLSDIDRYQRIQERDRRFEEARATALENFTDPELQPGDVVRGPAGNLNVGQPITVDRVERHDDGSMGVYGKDSRGRDAVFKFPGVDREGNPVTELEVISRGGGGEAELPEPEMDELGELDSDYLELDDEGGVKFSDGAFDNTPDALAEMLIDPHWMEGTDQNDRETIVDILGDIDMENDDIYDIDFVEDYDYEGDEDDLRRKLEEIQGAAEQLGLSATDYAALTSDLNDTGWAVKAQFQDILGGQSFEDQNANALEMIQERLGRYVGSGSDDIDALDNAFNEYNEYIGRGSTAPGGFIDDSDMIQPLPPELAPTGQRWANMTNAEFIDEWRDITRGTVTSDMQQELQDELDIRGIDAADLTPAAAPATPVAPREFTEDEKYNASVWLGERLGEREPLSAEREQKLRDAWGKLADGDPAVLDDAIARHNQQMSRYDDIDAGVRNYLLNAENYKTAKPKKGDLVYTPDGTIVQVSSSRGGKISGNASDGTYWEGAPIGEDGTMKVFTVTGNDPKAAAARKWMKRELSAERDGAQELEYSGEASLFEQLETQEAPTGGGMQDLTDTELGGLLNQLGDPAQRTPEVQAFVDSVLDEIRRRNEERGFGAPETPAAPATGPKTPVGFVGRARSTGAGGPRERQVRYSDGTTAWVEEGSGDWDAAAQASAPTPPTPPMGSQKTYGSNSIGLYRDWHGLNAEQIDSAIADMDANEKSNHFLSQPQSMKNKVPWAPRLKKLSDDDLDGMYAALSTGDMDDGADPESSIDNLKQNIKMEAARRKSTDLIERLKAMDPAGAPEAAAPAAATGDPTRPNASNGWVPPVLTPDTRKRRIGDLPAGSEVMFQGKARKVGAPIKLDDGSVVSKYWDGQQWDYVQPETTFDVGHIPADKPLSKAMKDYWTAFPPPAEMGPVEGPEIPLA